MLHRGSSRAGRADQIGLAEVVVVDET